MQTKTVLIAYQIDNAGASIVGEYTFAPASDSHAATYAAGQALAAAATQLESELGLHTERVVLFGSKSAEHNAQRLAAARDALIERFAA
jgi:cysteine sulfinate desulfinase/cysteine desulfurase-like protein